MALIAIHPGEHLAEELQELKMSAAELARKIALPHQPGYTNHERHAVYHGGYGSSSRSFLWYECSVLAQSPESLRSSNCSEEGREVNSGSPKPKPPQTCSRVKTVRVEHSKWL